MASKINLRSEVTLKNIESLLTKKLKKNNSDYPWIIGTNYIFRTVTMCDIGTVTDIKGNFVILENAVWIPDTGLWGKCLRDPNEIEVVEPFVKPVGVNIDSIVDYSEWILPLPKSKGST